MDPDYDLFVEIAQAGSLSGAARQLRLSPASVSKRLARLEARLGVQLIRRTTRRIALTAQGQDLLRRLLPIQADLRAAEAAVSGEAAALRGLLRVTAPTSFGRMHVAPALPAFLIRHPQVELRLDLDDGFVDLGFGRYDLAIRIGGVPGADDSQRAVRLADNRRVLCAAPAYLERRGVPAAMDDLAAHDLLAADGQFPWRLHTPAGPHILHGRSAVRTGSSEVVRELALGGAGIALRSLWDVGAHLAAGRLRRILPQVEGSPDVAIYALHPPIPNDAPARAALIAHLQDCFGAHRDW